MEGLIFSPSVTSQGAFDHGLTKTPMYPASTVSGSDMIDKIAAPTRPTVLKDVDDGRGRRNVSLPDSRTNIEKEGRQPYTGWRGYIHILLFPSVLDHHGLDIVASRYYSSVWLDFYRNDKKPTLNNRNDNANPNWGAPSYG